MPALNFQKQFAAAVESGEKRQTIRKQRKRPFRGGDTLFLYTGQRSRKCRNLLNVRCKSVEPFAIERTREGFVFTVGNRELDAVAADEMALADGFDDFFGMIDWFERTHGLPFEGVLIRW